MGKLTKRQHVVPASYLEGWVDANGQFTVHDLQEEKYFLSTPTGVLTRRYYYEDDASAPDNRVEQTLSGLEGDWASLLKKIRPLGISSASENDRSKSEALFNGSITVDDLFMVRRFATYQYLRIPGAVEQKAYELETSSLSEQEKSDALRPGKFLESGAAYLKPRVDAMMVTFLLANNGDFITSDWPCFDMKDSDDAPLIGEELGRNPKVIAYVPLTPYVSAVLHMAPQEKVNTFKSICQAPDEVRNHNELIVQQAIRFVIAKRHEPYIIAHAKTRKRNRADWLPKGA